MVDTKKEEEEKIKVRHKKSKKKNLCKLQVVIVYIV
jgi:hypothetical protein